MPLGKYYCDYCDKQFQDTPSARRRHLQGIQHQRAKALWYDSFNLNDQQRFQAHALGKGVCNHFVRTGFCQYGDSCKYFHPKPNTQIPTQAIPGDRNAVVFMRAGSAAKRDGARIEMLQTQWVLKVTSNVPSNLKIQLYNTIAGALLSGGISLDEIPKWNDFYREHPITNYYGQRAYRRSLCVRECC